MVIKRKSSDPVGCQIVSLFALKFEMREWGTLSLNQSLGWRCFLLAIATNVGSSGKAVCFQNRKQYADCYGVWERKLLMLLLVLLPTLALTY
jgi:hypothetical protein